MLDPWSKLVWTVSQNCLCIKPESFCKTLEFSGMAYYYKVYDKKSNVFQPFNKDFSTSTQTSFLPFPVCAEYAMTLAAGKVCSISLILFDN